VRGEPNGLGSKLHDDGANCSYFLPVPNPVGGEEPLLDTRRKDRVSERERERGMRTFSCPIPLLAVQILNCEKGFVVRFHGFCFQRPLGTSACNSSKFYAAATRGTSSEVCQMEMLLRNENDCL
jgi:hypothetical protein